MRLYSIATSMLVAAAAAAPLAHAAPQIGTQVSQLRANIVEVGGYSPSGDAEFTAKSYINFDGSRAGSVFLQSYIAGYQFIFCAGPEFANAATMNQSTGAVSVDATIDASSPNCFTFNYFGPPLTLRVSGQPDGNERVSESGAGTQQLFSETYKYNFQSDAFSEVFTGTMGLYTGSFTGRATNSRSTNRIKVR